ncbi:MAG: 1-acyl-sn-glycerol-3-phosphate acyltransferase [Candidatus Omnitrophica bacterium]|nr:1-acyl-sn-glycerol-3-phosphate acyltransferase [Candidatus Omnitrophota bacterium]
MLRNFWYLFSRDALKCMVYAGFRVKFNGRKNVPEPPFIVASNHASNLDPVLVGAVTPLPLDFMAKKELFDPPVIGTWSRAVGCIEVKRGANAVGSLKEALHRLKNGRNVAIFPEGTRSDDGEINEAKRGIGFLISKAKVPVVPVFIAGTYDAMPKGKKVKFGSRISVNIGKPVMPNEIFSTAKNEKDYDAVVQNVMQRINNIKIEIEKTSRS